MSATVLDGRAIAAEISAQVTRDVARFTTQRRRRMQRFDQWQNAPRLLERT